MTGVQTCALPISALASGNPTYYNIGTTTISVPATVTSIWMAPNVCLVYSGTSKALSFATRSKGIFYICVNRARQDWNTNNGGSGTDVTSTGVYLDAQLDSTFYLRVNNFWTGVDSYALSNDSSGVKFYPIYIGDNKIGVKLRSVAGVTGNNQNLIIGGRVRINSSNCSGGTSPFAGTYGIILGGASQSNNQNLIEGTNLEGTCVETSLRNYGSYNTFKAMRTEGNPNKIIFETGSTGNVLESVYGGSKCDAILTDNGAANECHIPGTLKFGGSVSVYSADNLCFGRQCDASSNRLNNSNDTDKRLSYFLGGSYGGFGGASFKIQQTANTALCEANVGDFILAGMYCYSLGGFFLGSNSTTTGGTNIGLTRKAQNLLALGDGSAVGNTSADFIKRFEVDTTATVASATTIAPTTRISFVTGVTAIATITAPTNLTGSNTGGCIVLIPDPATGPFTTTTAGNIALASTGVVSKPLTLCYLASTSKWYPSY